MNLARALLLILMTLAVAVGAEPAATVAVQFDAPEGSPDLTITRTAAATPLPSAPVLDGRLDDEAWRSAAPVGTLTCVGSVQPAPVETEVHAGYFNGVLYLGILCHEPERRPLRQTLGGRDAQTIGEDSLAVLLNPRNDRSSVGVILVNPLGASTCYRRTGAQRDTTWDPGAQVACGVNEFGWAVEMALPRRAFDDPLNDIIGFNVVRRRPGTEGEPFAWNPAPAAFEDGRRLGLLCFQTRPCAVQKVEVGWPRVGTNRVRVWIRNTSELDQRVRVGIATLRAPTSVDRSRYRLTVPRGKTVQYAFVHRIAQPGPCELEFAMTEEDSGRLIARFTRPGLPVAAAPMALGKAEVAEKSVQLRFQLLMPLPEAAAATFHAVVRNPATLQPLSATTTVACRGRSGVIQVQAPGLPAGDYQVHAWTTAGGEVTSRALGAFTLP